MFFVFFCCVAIAIAIIVEFVEKRVTIKPIFCILCAACMCDCGSKQNIHAKLRGFFTCKLNLYQLEILLFTNRSTSSRTVHKRGHKRAWPQQQPAG